MHMCAHSRVCRCLRGCSLASGAFDFVGIIAEVGLRLEGKQ